MGRREEGHPPQVVGGGGPSLVEEDKNPGPEAGPEHAVNTRAAWPGTEPKSGVAESRKEHSR